MAPMPPAGSEFAGYRLVWAISKGSMSTLFLAEDQYLGTVIALKVLDPSLAGDDAFRVRFLEESRIAAALSHPNVIPIHDIGSSDGLVYVAMRCVTGTDLRQLLQESPTLPADRAMHLIGQAARALDAAHRHGLVHRGIKPSNLLVEPGDGGSRPDHLYVTDFGIAGQPAGGTWPAGTLDYLAPEQFGGLPVGPAADQFSLGCVLFQCLTGRLPSGGDAGTADADPGPVPATAHRPDLPPAIDEVFARVLAVDPGERFENCREFVAAARRALGPVTDPRAAGGSPLLRPVSYPAPPHGPVLAGPVLAAPVPEQGSGRGRSHGGDHGRWRGWLPGSGRWLLSWSARWPVRVRGLGWLPALAALVLVAGTTAGVTLSLTSGNGNAAAAGSAAGAARQAAASARPSATASLSAPVGPSMTASPPMRPSPSMTASASMSLSPPRTARPTATAGPSMPMAASTNNCTTEQPGNGTSGPATLVAVLADANRCSVPRSLVPATRCRPGASTTPGEQIVTCVAPASHIVQVTFRTYPTLAALYGAYASSVSSLAGTGALAQNTRASCGATGAPYAEAAWNHQEVHPRQYTAAQMAAGLVPQLSAMGRLACFSRGTSRYLVWTTDVGRMLAVVTGSGSPADVYDWWAALHHVIIFPGTEMCGMAERMDSVPLGNLVQEPVCPAGAAMAAG